MCLRLSRMSKETFIKVQVCELKVGIRCAACVKEVKKILHRIEGMYQTKIDTQQGKVTVIGQMDMDTVLRKLKKAGKSAKLWNENPEVASMDQMPQLDHGGKGLTLGEASGGGGGGTTSATGVLPQPTPAPALLPTPAPPLHPILAPALPQQPMQAPAPAPPLQLTPAPRLQLNLQQQIEKRLRMMMGTKLLPPNLMGGKTPFPVVAQVDNSDNKRNVHDRDFKEDELTNMLGKPRTVMPMRMAPPTIGGDYKKVGAGTDIPAPMKENANHGNKRGAGMKQNLDARGNQVKNGFPGSLNNNSCQDKKDGSIGGALFSVNGPMDDGMLLQQEGMSRPGQVGYGAMGFMGHSPAMGSNGRQQGGGSVVHGYGHGHGMPTTGGGISAAGWHLA